MQPLSKLDIPALAASFDFRAVQLSLGGDYGKAEDAFRRLFPTGPLREIVRLAVTEKGLATLADWPMAGRAEFPGGYVSLDAKNGRGAWCHATEPGARLTATVYVECPSLSRDAWESEPYRIAVETFGAVEIVPPKLTLATPRRYSGGLRHIKTMRDLRENGRAA